MTDILDRIMDKLEVLYTKPSPKSERPSSMVNPVLFPTYLLFFSLFLAFLVFVFIVFLAPMFIQSENRTLLGIGAIAYNLVSAFMMCHQLPMRSLLLFGVQQAVCARDIGIYVGMSLAGLLFLFRKPDFFKTKTFFLITLAPIVLDGVTQTVLHLRESSNLLRLLTGFIFGFGLVFFVFTRIKRLNAPEFRQTLTRKTFILSLAVILFIMVSILISAGSLFGEYYVSRGDAIQIALNSSSKDAITFYVAPRTPLTFHFYPFKESYDDYVLSDFTKMEWVGEQIQLFFNGSFMLNQSNLFDVPGTLKHYYGIWVVVQPSGEDMQDENAVYPKVRGTYYYVDALTGEVFDTRVH